MFIGFFNDLKAAGVPVTLREYLTLMEALYRGCGSVLIVDWMGNR